MDFSFGKRKKPPGASCDKYEGGGTSVFSCFVRKSQIRSRNAPDRCNVGVTIFPLYK
jgi:hypothetical protein